MYMLGSWTWCLPVQGRALTLLAQAHHPIRNQESNLFFICSWYICCRVLSNGADDFGPRARSVTMAFHGCANAHDDRVGQGLDPRSRPSCRRTAAQTSIWYCEGLPTRLLGRRAERVRRPDTLPRVHLGRPSVSLVSLECRQEPGAPPSAGTSGCDDVAAERFTS